MAVTMNRGLVDTADPLSNELKIDMREKISQLDVDTTQFSTMLMKLPQERANSFKVEWMNDEFVVRHTGLSASATSAATTLSVTADEGHYFKAGDIIRITSTGEGCRVVAQSASAISVVRAVGTVTAASAASGTSGIVIVSGSNEQGATAPDALITQRVAAYNYTSIIRNVYRFTETAMATAWYGGPLQAKERRKKAVEHKWEIENTLFFGARSYSAGTNNPRHTAGGLIEYVTAETDAAGAFDKGELQDFLREGLEFGGPQKVLFAAPLPAQVMSEFLQDSWVRANPDESVFGVKVDFVISGVAGQKVPVIVKKEWKRYAEGSSKQYGSRAVLVDMQNVQLAPLRDTVLKPNRQTPDADEQKAEFITEVSLKVETPRAHRWLINVTG